MKNSPTPLLISTLISVVGAVPALHAEPSRAIERTPQTQAAIAHRFSPADDALLNEIQHGAFLYFWNEVGTPCPLVKDRKLGPVCSIAAVGFQLASLPIGVERGWITKAQGRERAADVLRCLLERDDNKTHGVYQHFPDLNTGGMSDLGYERVASTVDHALFLAGALVAGSYFENEVGELADRVSRETNWRPYAVGPKGYISMGWRVENVDDPQGPGQFLTNHWWNAGAEERLIYFLGAGHPDSDRGIDPKMYYQLERPVTRWRDHPPFVVTWPGALFTHFFAQCYIDHRGFEHDDPQQFGSDEPPVDWFENSRRAALLHRLRAVELSKRYKTMSAERWGLSACDGPNGYLVPHLRPNIEDKDRLHNGVVAPYAAGSAIMFTPQESIAALRAFRELEHPEGGPLLWSDPAKGGYGFADAFCLDPLWVSKDYLGIDQGPMLLGIENARTGLIWKLFMQHPVAQKAVRQLQFTARIDAAKTTNVDPTGG